MPTIKISQTFLQSPKTLAPGLYWDTSVKGFGVRVGRAGRPTAYVFQKSGGRRFTLGAVDEIELPEARREALAKAAIKPGKKGPRLSVKQGLERHLADMETRGCQPTSIELMRDEVTRLSGALLDRRLDAFTHATLHEAHARITRENGPVVANRWVRHLRTIFNTAVTPWPAPRLRRNPVRRGTPPVGDVAALGALLRELDNPILADWWRFVLLTGLRKTDALTVRWEDVDAKRKGWLFRPSPKGGERKAFEIPITTQLCAIIDRQPRVNEWVFSGNRRGMHFTNPRKEGLPRIHSLRATWTSRAAEIGCPIPVIKRLLNHSTNDDVTMQYITVSDSVLKEWAQKVADSLWADINSD